MGCDARFVTETEPLNAAGQELLAVLYRRAHASFRDQLPEPLFSTYILNLEQLARREDVDLATVRSQGHIIGAVAYRDTVASPAGDIPGFASFRGLAVAPEARGAGIGRILATWAIDRARSKGAAGVAIHSAPFQHVAHTLYQRLGFVRAPELDFDVGSTLPKGSPPISIVVHGLKLPFGRDQRN